MDKFCKGDPVDDAIELPDADELNDEIDEVYYVEYIIDEQIEEV